MDEVCELRLEWKSTNSKRVKKIYIYIYIFKYVCVYFNVIFQEVLKNIYLVVKMSFC